MTLNRVRDIGPLKFSDTVDKEYDCRKEGNLVGSFQDGLVSCLASKMLEAMNITERAGTVVRNRRSHKATQLFYSVLEF